MIATLAEGGAGSVLVNAVVRVGTGTSARDVGLAGECDGLREQIHTGRACHKNGGESYGRCGAIELGSSRDGGLLERDGLTLGCACMPT